MRQLLTCIALCVLANASLSVAGSETYVIAKISDHAKEVTYEVILASEGKKLEKKIGLEKRFHSKALRMAEKAWMATEEQSKTKFPRSAISPRKVSLKGSYKSRDKADDKVFAMEESDLERAERKRERKKAPNTRDKRKMKALARAAARDLEKAMLADTARQLYADKLDEVMNPPKKAE